MRPGIAIEVCFVLTLAVPVNVFPAIVTTDGDVVYYDEGTPPPTSVIPGQQHSDLEIVAFTEWQAWTLLGDVNVNISAVGTYDETDDLTPGVILLGTPVASHFLHVDPVETNAIGLGGSVTFQARILGVIILTPELDQTDASLGRPGTTYPTLPAEKENRGLELDTQEDRIIVHDDLRTLSVHLETCCNIDQIRVITDPTDTIFISEVIARQRSDASKLVDIDYVLMAGEGSSNLVEAFFTVAGIGTLPATAVWGDVGDGVVPGATNHITWNPAAEPVPVYSGLVTIQLETGEQVANSASFAVAPSPPGDLSGVVNDPDGDAIDGVLVAVAPGLVPDTTTGGQYSFTNVPAGKVKVTFTKTGYHQVVRDATIREDSMTILNVVMALRPALIQGPEVVEVSSKYTSPDRHAYYIRDVPLKEDFTARIDWHEGEYVPPYAVRWYIGPPEDPKRNLVYNDNEYLLPPPPKVLTHPFEMGSDFLVGERLTVVAVSFANDQGLPEWPSQPYLANFDVINEVDAYALPKGNLVVNTGSSTLKYDVREDAVDMTALDDGKKDGAGGMPFFGGQMMSFGVGGVVNGSIRDDGSIELSFATPSDYMPGTDVGPVGFTATASGSFVWAYKDDSWKRVSATFTGGVTAEASFYTYVWYAPPVYVAIVVGFDGSIGVVIQGWDAEWGDDLAMIGNLTPWVEGVLGVGIKDMGDLEAYLRGGLSFDFCQPWGQDPCGPECWGLLEKFGVFAKGGVRLHWMGWEVFDISHTWSTTLCGGRMLSPPIVYRQRSGPRVMQRNYLARPHDDFGDEPTTPGRDSHLAPGRQSRAATVETEVENDSFPRSIPSLTAIGNKLLMVSVTDDRTRTALNGTKIVYRTCTIDYATNTCDWSSSTPAPVHADGTADYRPHLSTVPGTSDAWVTWENVKEVLPDGSTLDDTRDKTEIAVNRYTGESWGTQDLRTNNDYLDRTPLIAAAGDGTAILTWVSESDDPPDRQYALHWDFYDGESWSSTPTSPITSGTERIIDTALAYNGSQAVLLFTKDPHNVVFDLTDDHTYPTVGDTTVEDRDLYGVVFTRDNGSGSWGLDKQLTDEDTDALVEDASPEVAYDSNGNAVVVWYRCQNIYSGVLNTAVPKLTGEREIVNLSDAFAAGGDFRLAKGPGDALAVVWQSTSKAWQDIGLSGPGTFGAPIEVEVDIWYAVYEPTPPEPKSGLWSLPLQLTHDAQMERSMAPVYVPNGDDPNEPPKLIMAYNKVDLRYGDPETITFGEGNTAVTIEDVHVPVFPEDNGDPYVETDLYVLHHTISGDLSVAGSDVTVSPPNPLPGSDATITAVVRNLGDTSRELIGVNFYDNGEVINLQPEIIAGPLVGGASAEVSTVWTVPASAWPHNISVALLSEERADDVSENDEATIVVLEPDLIITDILAHAAGPDRLLTVRVANVGVLPTTMTTEVIVRWEPAKDGGLVELTRLPVPVLPAGAFHDASYRWVDAPTGHHPIWAVVDEGELVAKSHERELVAQFDETNNTRFAVVDDYTGACCNPNGTCDDDENAKNAIQCSSAGGAWQGLGTDCTGAQCSAQPGACCLPGEACVDANSAAECAGTFRGHGTVCTDPLPCCQGGGCVEVAPVCCGGKVGLYDCTGFSDGDGELCDNCDGSNPLQTDCQGNGIGDACEIVATCAATPGPFFCTVNCDPDCNNNCIPDECDPDCNGNGVPDDCDVGCLGCPVPTTQTSSDCDSNAVPDECQPDCDGNRVPDLCEINKNSTAPGEPFFCDSAAPPPPLAECDPDCNDNGIPDNCEPDCNGNGVPDDYDISIGTSEDLDANGIPDECQRISCEFEGQAHCQLNTGKHIFPSDRFQGTRRADDFHPMSSPIGSICFVFAYLTDGGDECSGVPPPDDFHVEIYEDNFGFPDTMVVNSPGAVVIDRKELIRGLSTWQFHTQLDMPVEVTPGNCYWLEITGMGDDECSTLWAQSMDGNNYSLRDDNGEWTAADIRDNDVVWCIDPGIVVPTEPGTNGGCGDLPVCCCTRDPKDPYYQATFNECSDVGNFGFPYSVCGTFECPDPPNDLCTSDPSGIGPPDTAAAVCLGDPEHPEWGEWIFWDGLTAETRLGQCNDWPGSAGFGQVCDPIAQDCREPDTAICLPWSPEPGVYPEAYECWFDGDNRLASTDGPVAAGPCGSDNAMQADVWHNITAPCRGRAVVTMCDGEWEYDGMLSVYGDHTPDLQCPGPDPEGNETLIECNDDYCTGSGTVEGVHFDAVEGAVYLLRQGGWSANGELLDAGQGKAQFHVGFFCAPAFPFVPPGLPPNEEHHARKHRYISVDATTNLPNQVSIKVEIAEMNRCQNDLRRSCIDDEDCPTICAAAMDIHSCGAGGPCPDGVCIPSGPCGPHPNVGLSWYVQEPQTRGAGCPNGMCDEEDWYARVAPLPEPPLLPYSSFWDECNATPGWTGGCSTLHIGDCELVPGVTYNVYACLPEGDPCSDPLPMETTRKSKLMPHYGDVAGAVTVQNPCCFTPPDDYTSVIDFGAYLLTNQNWGTTTNPQAHPTWIDLHGPGDGIPPQYIIMVTDLQMILRAFVNIWPYENSIGGLAPGNCP